MKRYKMSGHYGGPHEKPVEIEAVESKDGEWVKWKDVESPVFHSGETMNAYICPMCRGRKQIDLDEHGLYSPGDPLHLGPCILCNGEGFVVK